MSALEEKIRDMLAMPVSSEPDSAIDYRALVKRIVTVEDSNFDGDCNSGVRVIIKVTPQDIKYPELYAGNFAVFYRGSIGRGGGAGAQGRKLIEFIESLKGQKAHVVYTKKSLDGVPSSTLQMIAPVQINQQDLIYAKGDDKNDRLGPYQPKTPIQMRLF